MKKISHTNNGNCQKCEEILNSFGGTYPYLKQWFIEKQKEFNYFHVSGAGRNDKTQNEKLKERASKAAFGESSHNFMLSLGIDTFMQHPLYPNNLYPKELYDIVMKDLDNKIVWFGAPNAKFREYAHCQMKNWKQIVIDEKISLIYS